MKTRWLVRSVVLFGSLGFGGCENAGAPTEPNVGLNVNGAWTGSMTSYSPACAREGVSVSLSQEGEALRGNFQTSCNGMLDIRGRLAGDSVSGTLNRGDGSSMGQISGTASRASIRITTWGPLAREDDGPQSRTVVNVIELER